MVPAVAAMAIESEMRRARLLELTNSVSLLMADDGLEIVVELILGIDESGGSWLRLRDVC